MTVVRPSNRAVSINSQKSAASTTYSCGRGGAGNMYSGSERAMFSFDEELTRERVREEGAAPVYHVGRGGAGNLVRRKSEDSASRVSNESAKSGIDKIWGKISGSFLR
jgi:hypothetical protein